MNDSPLCKYSKCERPITQGQWGAEGDEAFAERLRSGYCRSKCRRLDKPAPSPRDHIASTGRMVVDPTVWNLQRPEGKEQPKDKPVRDAARLAFARSMPCCMCGAIQGIHAHHEQEEGHGVMGGKTSDRRTAPLCPRCHTMRHGLGRGFYTLGKNVDIEEVIAMINDAYDKIKKGGR